MREITVFPRTYFTGRFFAPRFFPQLVAVSDGVGTTSLTFIATGVPETILEASGSVLFEFAVVGVAQELVVAGVEQFANLAHTILNGAIDSSTTTVTVVSASKFPTVGNFRIVVDSEIMLVTDVSGNVFTVARGQEGTATSAHANGADCTHVLTRGSLAAFRSDAVVRDVYASRPSTGVLGRLHVESDSQCWAFDGGVKWNVFGRGVFQFTKPNNDDFAWVNQGDASLVLGDSIDIVAPASATRNLRIRKKAAPATPYTITAYVVHLVAQKSFCDAGLCWRDSASGKVVTFGVWGTDTAVLVRTSRFNSPTAHLSDGSGFPVNNAAFDFSFGSGWIRIQDDGTNRAGLLSNDKVNWVTVFSEARTTHTTPNEVGFFVDVENVDFDCVVRLFSWEEG